MAAYDIFLKNSHSDKNAQMMVKNNKKLFDYLCSLIQTKEATVLEVGPGKGYFKEAVVNAGGGYKYYAVDRN